jgi:DHA1 family inner membrane transport protein
MPGTRTADARRDSTDWGVVFGAMALGVVAALHIGKVPPALPAIRADLDLGLVGGGFVVSTFNALGMVLGMLIGGLSDRFGRRRAAIAGYASLMLGGALGALASGLPVLLASRALEGLGFMAVGVTMPGIVSAAASERDRPLALGLWSVFTPLGFAIALLVTPIGLATVGWRGVWAALAVVSLIALVLLLPRLPSVTGGTKAGFGRRLREVLSRPRMWCLAAAFGTYAFQWVTLMAWLPTYLTGALGFALGAASLVTALVVAMNVPGNIVAGVLLRGGASPAYLIALGSAVMAGAAAALFLQPGLGASAGIGLCLLFSLFGGLIPSILFARVPSAAPSSTHASQANGMLLQGSATGQFIGPPLIGAAVAAAGGAWSGAVLPLVLAALLTAGLGAFATGPRPSRAT